MNGKDSAALTDFDVGTDTEKARHTQWRRLSRKRRRTLIRRTLRKLEEEAERKSVFVGLDDYSHVQSLVFSELPYNPNGHHCSCNCLDEIIDDPELEVYGWNYGKLLKKSELGYYSDADNDDVLLKDYSVVDIGTKLISENTLNLSKSLDEDDLRTGRSEPSTARSYMGGSLDMKADSNCDADKSDTFTAMSIRDRESTLPMEPDKLEDNAATMTIDEYDNKSIVSSRKQLSSNGENCKHQRCGSERETRQGCHCNRVVSRRNTGRSSITSEMFKVGTSAKSVCSKCQNLLNVINKFRNLPSSRRLSLAKDDGSLRSRIFGLRQKLRHYDDLIQRNDNLTVQKKIKRKQTIGDKVQKNALSLSDCMKLMKVKESYYRSKSKDLEQRLSASNPDGRRSTINASEESRSWKIQMEGDNELEERDSLGSNGSGDLSPGQQINTFNRSPRKTGRRRLGNELPALLEEDEENMREIHSSDGRIEHSKNDDEFHKTKKENSPYDILFVNHSDNEVESKGKDDDDYDSEDSDGNEDNDDLVKSWPAYRRDSLKLDFWKIYDARKIGRRKSKADLSQEHSVRKIVHRLDSGLSFGSGDTEILHDESLISSVNKVEEEKISKGDLEEEEYHKPLVERQRSFGDIIRKVIRQEIQRKRSSSLDLTRKPARKDEESLEQEIKRRRSINEENVKEFVNEAQKKMEIVEQRLIDKDNGLIESLSGNMNDDYHDENNQIKNRPKLVDLSTLRTLAQKHQTFKSLRNLDEELYEVSEGVDKLNNYRMKEAKARICKEKAMNGDDSVPLSKREEKFSIPDPMNKKSLLEDEIADNNKTIAKIDFHYDMIRDLRFLILNQNTSRANSYSYFKPAPPYLKTKWQHRIKRGFLRGVKEQKVNEIQLEKVEDVTYKTIDRSEIHKETLKQKLKEKKIRENEVPADSSPPSRLSTTRRGSSTLSKTNRESSAVKLPPLKLPSSRSSSPVDSLFDGNENRSRSVSVGNDNLRKAFKRLELRHKFLEKADMMKSVIRLSSYAKKNRNDVTDSSRTDRSLAESETEQRFKSRLKSNRRQSIAAVQNFASRDPMSGRVSVNSTEKRRLSLMHPIQEY